MVIKWFFGQTASILYALALSKFGEYCFTKWNIVHMNPFYSYLFSVGLFFLFAFLFKYLFLKNKNYASIQIEINERSDGHFDINYANQINIETPSTPIFYGNKNTSITMFIHIIFQEPIKNKEYKMLPIECNRIKINDCSVDEKNGFRKSVVFEFENIDFKKGKYLLEFGKK